LGRRGVGVSNPILYRYLHWAKPPPPMEEAFQKTLLFNIGKYRI